MSMIGSRQDLFAEASDYYGYSTRDMYLDDNNRLYAGSLYLGHGVRTGNTAEFRFDRNGRSLVDCVRPIDPEVLAF